MKMAEFVEGLRDNRLQFQDAVQGALDLGVFEDERALGHAFGVSRTQVGRWTGGMSLPIFAARKLVYQTLLDRALRLKC